MSSAGGMLLAVDGVPASMHVRRCRPVLLDCPQARIALVQHCTFGAGAWLVGQLMTEMRMSLAK
jgi:hypothetical protein